MRSKQIKKLDKLFSEYIRKRDGKCLKCGKKTNLQTAHIHSRRHFNTRWDETNAVTLCVRCHLFWAHKEPVEFTEWVKKLLGEKKYENLKIRARTIVKGQDLKAIEIYLKEKLKENNK